MNQQNQNSLGDYDDNVLNKEVRDNKEVIINNEKLNKLTKWFLNYLIIPFITIIYKKWKR